ncbi:hypothetical protein [uncultured Ruminococcus sp.]|uniref:hypothetical protein n=1 Tax=uncultured Ruminococcus sp. TaxID=165186 RepID=UPI0025D3654A|nr:hypothetical protein [uncultured Ruminococcus sp.]
MGRGRPIKVVNMVSLNGPDGEYRPLEELTDEELKYFRSKMSEKVSKFLSDYYTQHPDEFEILCSKLDNTTA